MRGSALVDTVRPSANSEQRIGIQEPRLIVLHYTGMQSGGAAVEWLCNPLSKVSCHYLIDVDGSICQMVDEELRAWHAGQSSWRGISDVNSMSVGIEIQNEGHAAGCPPFPDLQMQRVVALCLDIMARYGLAPDQVVAHSDVAPGRKIDPGEAFDWPLLARHGIGVMARARPASKNATVCQIGDSGTLVSELQHALTALGYGTACDGNFGTQLRLVVEAFQRRYRPALVNGIADDETVELLDRLIAVQEAAHTV